MDNKFRKLISRLSIKEKKIEKELSYPRMLSISPQPPADEPVSKIAIDEEESSPLYDIPNSNILTNVKFPCPTLLRKSKSMSENVYEEVKINPRKVSLSGSEDESSCSTRSRSNSDSTDENNNTIGNGDEVEAGSDQHRVEEETGGEDMNLQELEQARRRLIAAQRVRAKYAENWIDGQIVDESILGDNKEKTKIYWESRMRNEILEKEREKFNGLNKGRNRLSSSSTSTVIQKINAEIEELHRREKELQLRSVSKSLSNPPITHNNTTTGNGIQIHNNEEDDDVFSSNGSSVDEFEHSESPRLESGFYSNLGEDETHTQIELVTSSPDPKLISDPSPESRNSISKQSTPTPLLTVSVNLGQSLESLKSSEHGSSIHSPIPTGGTTTTTKVTRMNSLEVAPICEAEEPEVFTFQKETPIEKEIRLAREREEDYKRQRLTSMGESVVMSPKTPTAAVAAVSVQQNSPQPSSPSFKSDTIKPSELDDKRFGTLKSSPRNIQYIMATERLRREMLEAQQREDELRKVHRTVSMSTLYKIDEPDIIEMKTEILTTTPEDTLADKIEAVVTDEYVQPIPEMEKQKPETKPEIDNHPIKTQDPPITFRKNSFTKPGLNSFNSIQRYLLKSSVQLRIAKNFQLPPSPKPEEKPEPIKSVVEENEPETPRRKLIPATHKIQNELREMKEREKELALIRTRSFKSTPNLLDALERNDEAEEKIVTIIETKTFTPRQRQRSTLINQWEELSRNAN